ALRVVGLKGEQAGRSADDLAHALGIDAVLNGDLQRSGDTVRITLRLVSTAGGRALWARTYDGELRRILDLQDEVARSVADRISISLTFAERSRLSAAKPEIDPAAYQAYLRGWHFLERVSGPDFRRALGYFHDAIKIDPAYAPAYVGLALTYEELGYYGLEPPSEAYPRSRSAALKALEFDSTMGEAHATLASYDASYSWNFEAAEEGYRRALELSPKFARGHFEYGMLLTSLGRIDEALEQMRQSQELDPLSQLNQAAAARPYYNGRRYEEAIVQAKRALELDSTFSRAHYWLGMTYAQIGRARDAITEFELTLRQAGAVPVYQAALAYAYARAGEKARARAMLAALQEEARSKPVSGVEIAAVHAALGNTEACFEWLSHAFERRDPLMRFVAVDPRLDPVRSDTRFEALLARVGFPPRRAGSPSP
ncbi:MAG TPA: tetratricopeptide repeat protein, partial [Gemmatimonadales bacterium]|nr:tetratricopeptide repeat protein [Gemmatimonadales bacterium]